MTIEKKKDVRAASSVTIRTRSRRGGERERETKLDHAKQIEQAKRRLVCVSMALRMA
jgi:hypothetical protein